ncbi:MAG: DUF4465 domain-containing protein [Bacteroidales bacterium]|nr:DUF4465 domain-containing protein [Bacteroidales bacterium]
MKTIYSVIFASAMALMPSGASAVELCMTSGDHGTVTLTEPVDLYDDGGAEGPLGDGIDSRVVFEPATDGGMVKLTFSAFKMAYTDYLYVYNGREAVGEALIGTYKGSTKPAQIISTATDGSLTVVFKTAASHHTNNEGFAAKAETYALKDLEIASVGLAAAGNGKAVRGASDVPVARLALGVEGDRLTTSLASLSGRADGAVTAVKAWYTGVHDGFAATDCIGSATVTDGAFDIQFDRTLTFDVQGSYYIYVTADIEPDAAVGSDVTISEVTAAGIKADGETKTEITAGFAAGTYTIGAEGADYATIGEAVKAMGGAVEGAVTFRIMPGTYAEDVMIADLQGTGAERTVTFVAEDGDVFVTGAGYKADPTSYSSPKTAVVQISGSPYVVFQGITFNPSTPYPRVICLYGASHHVTLRDCMIDTELCNESKGNTRYAILTESPTNVSGANADFLTVEGCTVKGGYIAMFVQGSQGYVAYEPVTGLTVRGNTFADNCSKSVYLNQVSDAVISGNTFTTSPAVTKNDYNAIDLSRVNGNMTVSHNLFTLSHDKRAQAIFIRTDRATSAPMLVYNNAIAMTASPEATSYGIKVTSNVCDIDLAHNTVAINGKNGRAIGFDGAKVGADNRISVRNNLLQNLADAGEVLYMTNTNNLAGYTWGGNAVYAESGSFSNVAATVADWTALTGSTPVEERAEFLTAADLHLTDAGSLQCGVKVNHVADDIEGKMRPETPTAGAYEFAPVIIAIPELAEGYPVVSDVTTDGFTVKTRWSESGKVYVLAVEADAAAPDVDRITTEGTSADATAGTDCDVKLTGLADNTAFTAYIMMVSALDAQSAVATAQATTVRYIAPLTVTIDPEEYEEDTDYDAGQTLTIYPVIEGGDKPYTYSWTNRAGEKVGTDEALSTTLSQSEIYTITVTSADGQTASAYTLLTVYGSEGNATMEDNLLAPESSWPGYEDRDYMVFPWYSGAFAFDNMYWAAYNSWSGFAYSNSTSDKFVTLDDQFNTVMGGAHEGSQYGISFLWSPMQIHILKDREGAELDHIYVSNAAYSYRSMTVGDGFCEPFTTGDYLMISFTGDNPEGTPVEVYLADYRSENAAEHTILTDWQRVDLSPLGKVKNVSVNLSASNFNVPTYFVFDDLCYKDADGAADAIADSMTDAVSVRYLTTDGRMAAECRADNAGAVKATLVPGIYLVETTMADGSVSVSKTIVK